MSVIEYVERILAVFGGAASVTGLLLAVVVWRERRRMRSQPSWDEALRVADTLIDTIQQARFSPHLVIGLGRSGGIWGGWLAGNLGSLPFTVIDLEYEVDEIVRRVKFLHMKGVVAWLPDFIRERYKNDAGKPGVLVVEGASSTGRTFREFFTGFQQVVSDWDVKTAVLYKNAAVDVRIDFVGKEDLSPWPEKFPWHSRVGYKPHLRYVIEQPSQARAAHVAAK